MARKLWCVLLTAVMLLNLLPVGMAEEIGAESVDTIVETLAEPAPAAEMQQEVQEVQEEEAAEEPIPYEAEPQPEEEAAEEPSPSPVETELADEADGTLDILTIPEEEQPDDELPDMLMAAAKPEDEEIVEEEEDGEEEEPIPLTEKELAALGININEKVYPIYDYTRKISNGTYTITSNVNNYKNAWIKGTVKIILPDGLKLNFQNGLNVNSDASLNIVTPEGGSGTGILEAHGRANQAGIGGGYREAAGIIRIYGGVIRAYGGHGSAGIGGGEDGGGGGYVEITGGDVEAYGGRYGAGIGGGNGGYGGAKIITGGRVYAKGGEWASGIGGGSRGHSDGEIRITDNNGNGTNVTAEGGVRAAGIGGGFEGAITRVVTIAGGTVTAKGGSGGAGIGSGHNGTIVTSAGVITITGGTVTATGGEYGAGIGGGQGSGAHDSSGGVITISGGTVTANGGQDGAGIGGGHEGSSGHITIKGGTVKANGGGNGAGIGGGYDQNSQTITISNSTVTAHGGWGGAGIGGGNGSLGYGGNGGTVTITNSVVTAQGGVNAAGIGGGNLILGSGGIVTISDSIVTAQGGVNAAGIGGCDQGNGADLTVSGSSLVLATGGDRARAIGRGAPRPPMFEHEQRMGELKVEKGLLVFDAANGMREIHDPTPQKLDSARIVRIGKFIPLPRAANHDYNGREQSGYGNPQAHVHIEGTAAATIVGNYTFTVTPEPGYIWYDVTNEPKTVNWSIGQAKATVRANDLTITYGDKEPELTATVRGTVNGDRLNYQISRQPGTNAGRYTITVSGEDVQGYYDVSYQNGWLTIRPKNIPGIHRTEFQEIKYGSGEFTEPTFHDSALDEDITGFLAYYYSGRWMTGEELRTVLAGLPAGASGTIVWNFEANGNFAGTITGSIHFTVSRLEFTVDGAPATAANAVTIKNNPTYGDTWEELVTISDRIVASVNGEAGSGTYTLNVSGTPNAGRQTYSVLFTGLVGRITYTDVTVLTGEVDVAKADYKDVTKTASGELEPEAGRSVIITLPEIPQGTSYGTPRKAVESDPYRLFAISGNQIPVSLTAVPENPKPMTFIVPVNPADSNHNGYDITVTLTVKSGVHTHSFLYRSAGNQIIAICRNDNCPLPEGEVRLTLNAPANLVYDGKAKEVTFANGEAEAWKAATGSDAPVITYTADRGSALTGGKPVNAGSYTAGITVNNRRASLRFTVAKADYTDVTKEASAELNAARGSTVTITLPAIAQGASYGRPVKESRNDRFTLSSIIGNRIIVTSTGVPEDVNDMLFTVPVNPDGNHNGYTITVTLNVIRESKINVTVKTSRTWLGFVPVYHAAISASSPDTGILRVEHSLSGLIYTPGNQLTSLLPLSRFYIRVMDSDFTYHYYVYQNGQVYER